MRQRCGDGDGGVAPVQGADPTADRRVVETVLGFSDRQLVAPLDRRPIYERAFADLMGPPAPRMRGLQSADWHLAYEPEAIRAAMRRYGTMRSCVTWSM